MVMAPDQPGAGPAPGHPGPWARLSEPPPASKKGARALRDRSRTHYVSHDRRGISLSGDALKEDLLLLPGMLSDHACFDHQITHLEDLVRPLVVVLDQESRAAMADHVLKVAPERFAIVGISMGAWVAQEIAARAPERVSKAALLNTWASPISQETATLFREHVAIAERGGFEEIVELAGRRAFRPPRWGDETFMALYRAMAHRLGVGVYLRQMHAMLDPSDWRPTLREITCPTLVLHARNDVVFSLQEHQEIAAAIRGAQLAIVEDCGHASTMDQPQAVTALLRYWLEYCLPAPPSSRIPRGEHTAPGR